MKGGRGNLTLKGMRERYVRQREYVFGEVRWIFGYHACAPSSCDARVASHRGRVATRCRPILYKLRRIKSSQDTAYQGSRKPQVNRRSEDG